jgi:acid phosphatase family membrane protein YuiD
MSGLVDVKYKREPIMLWYSFWSTGSLSSSVSSAVVILIGVDRGFESSILNFLMMSFVYLA